MPAQVATGLVPIINALQTQLANAIPCAASQIKLTAHQDEVPKFDAEHDVVVRIGSFMPTIPPYSATILHRLRRYITVYPRTRMVLDPADRDTQWLLSTTGHIQWEEAVMKAIWGWFPNDAGDSTIGNLLGDCELQLSEGTDPVKGAIDKGWGTSSMTFELEYLFSLGAPPVAG